MQRLGFTLTPTVDTAIGQEVRAGIDRYVGVHPGAFGCADAVSDPDEASARHERYLGRAPQKVEWGWLISCERGGVALLSREKLQNQVPEMEIPTVPFIAGYVLQCRDLAVLTALLSGNGIVYRELTRNVVAVACPSVLGGILIFTSGAGATLGAYDRSKQNVDV